MPFYEYECSACKYYVEVLRKISDPPLIKCPSCGKQTLQRLLSAPVFRLKGSGWYETDFKSEKEQKRNIAGEAEAAPEKKESEESSKPVVRSRKKTTPGKVSQSTGAEAGSALGSNDKNNGKSPAEVTKKAAAKVIKKAPQQPLNKRAARKKAVKKAIAKQKSGKKTHAPAKPRRPAKKK